MTLWVDHIAVGGCVPLCLFFEKADPSGSVWWWEHLEINAIKEGKIFSSSFVEI